MSAIRLVSSLLVFLSPLLGAATPYLPAATQPGAANGSVTATTFSLSNQAVSGTWELTAGAWKFKSIPNHYSSKTFAPATPAELFTVALAGGTSVGSSSMTLKSGPLMENLAADFSAARFAEGLPGQKNHPRLRVHS